jgi:formylglycine-generating enzyme required for sulfatase activity
LLVFFSGHGYFDDVTRRGYLAFRDTEPIKDDPYYQSFVSHEDVRVLLERLDCNHVLLVVDSCFSGTLDPMVAMAPGARAFNNAYGLIPRAEYIQRKLQYRTRRYITAGGKEYVSDGRPGQHSPFARQFLTALRTFGGSDGILTLEEILLHLERVDPQPRTGELFGNEPGSSFVLVARPVEVPTPSKFATLTVQVTPPNADVHVTGGPPPAQSLLKTLRVQEKASERRYRLPQGQYQVRATLAGFHAESIDIQLTAQGQAVELLLERIEVRSDPVRPMAGRAAAETRIVSLPAGGGNMTFVWVPPGPFTMGGGEFPPYSATVDGFWIGTYEVTAGQFSAFVEANPTADAVLRLAARFPEENANAGDAVRSVDWPTAVAFCDWAGFTLPTEEQWECAAKGGQNLTFATLDGQMTDPRTDYSGLAVGAGQPNPFGIHDMSGNVWEWCSTKVPGGERVLRGGSDSSPLHEWRTFHKYSWNMNEGGGMTGFRCLLPQPAP